MCEFSGRLITWIDRELPAGEAANVERHIRMCAECRSQIATYERLSGAFEAYCDASLAAKTECRVPRWALAVSGIAAAALFLAWPRTRIQPPSPAPPLAATVSQPQILEAGRPPVSPAKPTVLVKNVHRQFASPPTQLRQQPLHRPLQEPLREPALPVQKDTAWLPPEPAIQIAIPAETMFPPGAVPEGANFTVDLTIAVDGSVQRLRLRP